MYFEEVDQISDDDLEAASDYYERLLNNTLPQHQAKQIALEQFGVTLDDIVLNSILGQYACTPLSIEDCVAKGLRMAGLI